MIRRALALGAVSVMGALACERTPVATDSLSTPLVVYVSADEAIARTVLGAFEGDTGIDVRMVGDTEAHKSTGLAMRLRQEAPRPVADVFWSSEISQVIKLAQEGVLAPVRTDVTEAWPEQWRDAAHRWHAFSPRPRVIVFQTGTNPDMIPDTWTQLFKGPGMVALADPRFGTTGGHLVAMARGLPAMQWHEVLDACSDVQDVLVVPGGNAGTVTMVEHGAVVFGCTDYDDVIAAQARGAKVDMKVLRHGDGPGEGPMLTPNAVGLVAGHGDNAAAERLVDWLLSDRAATLLAKSTSRNMPLQPSVQAVFPELVVDDPLTVDWTAAALAHDDVVEVVLQALRRQQSTAH